MSDIDKFKDAFRLYPDCYTIIGGTACQILMEDAGRDFRLTKDIDMIIIMEAENSAAFIRDFWKFIFEAGYRLGWRNNDDIHFYRFTDPKPGYPQQIELFSKSPDFNLNPLSTIIPIHVSDDISSLSAILLDDDYYKFMVEGRETIDGITVLDAAHLIPFKMFAWLDLTEKKARGERVNTRDLRKHRLDVFRLLQIVPVNTKINCIGRIKFDVNRFIEENNITDSSLKAAGIDITADEGESLLKEIYL